MPTMRSASSGAAVSCLWLSAGFIAVLLGPLPAAVVLCGSWLPVTQRPAPSGSSILRRATRVVTRGGLAQVLARAHPIYRELAGELASLLARRSHSANDHGTVPFPFPFASRGTGKTPEVTGCAVPGGAVNHGTVPVLFPPAFPFASRGTGRPPDVTGWRHPGRAVNHGTVPVLFPS